MGTGWPQVITTMEYWYNRFDWLKTKHK